MLVLNTFGQGCMYILHRKIFVICFQGRYLLDLLDQLEASILQ